MTRQDKAYIVRHLNDCLNEVASAKTICEKLQLEVLLGHLTNIEKSVNRTYSEILLVE